LSKTSIKERRAHERHDTELDIHGSPDQGGVVARMVARNLSLGGLYCTSSTDFPEMARLAVRLMLPVNSGNPGSDETEPVDLEAVVVRREEVPGSTGRSRFELALYFTHVEQATRRQLQRFLDRRAVLSA
jgi:hypothetical protein